ncbi:futalosine hydrolase [Actinoplanes sp. TRM 88003]|uniref:Futalosine hydrolase n=1 Tax=Paractinoplanes aksuensis TaxID=2939490 RepID=A0ABT1DRE5_9ACTN|nr:futalosine hydrolase [Actinoplanes aksuensis]MCO8273384.1 futalosine hydrolase [Actinoplanes aksuensis]
MHLPLLVVTAVPAEADAVRAGADPDHVVVAPVGVGPAAAAAGTARLLATGRYRAVISAGIAGGFPGRAPVGATVLATRSIAGDLGAETPDGFLTVDELGFGESVVNADPTLLQALTTEIPGAIVGDVVTLSTVTGTQTTADRLAKSYPQAVAEAMEGYGVAVAAAGLPFAELRTISNPVGPRDRAAWRLKEAFAALSTASARLWTACG